MEFFSWLLIQINQYYWASMRSHSKLGNRNSELSNRNLVEVRQTYVIIIFRRAICYNGGYQLLSKHLRLCHSNGGDASWGWRYLNLSLRGQAGFSQLETGEWDPPTEQRHRGLKNAVSSPKFNFRKQKREGAEKEAERERTKVKI